MKKVFWSILLSLFECIAVSSQTIELNLPSCNYLQYHLALKQGNKLDTVAVGRFDQEGKAAFDLPEKHARYRGVGQLSVTATPKKWNIILNNEPKISIKEIAETDDIEFIDSDENIFLVKSLSKQKEILARVNHFQPTSPFSSVFKTPKHEYEKYLDEIKASPLYAARMVELLNILAGIGIESQDEISKNQQDFIVNQLNYHDLYTSGFWQLTFDTWYQAATIGQEEMQGDSILLSQSRKMLDRTDDIPIRRELTQTLIRQFSKYGKDYLLAGLGTEYLNIPLNGKQAPELVAEDYSIKPKSKLLIFYDSDCGLCHNELYQLKEKYELLSNEHNGIDVISISGDTNRDEFEYTSSKMPWREKLCDFKGFDGDNFKNYGVVGTPTIILVDKEGIVRGRYARLNEFLKN